jgi:ubiquinone/menaquinone biosynthesis C-methylase UbiE
MPQRNTVASATSHGTTHVDRAHQTEQTRRFFDMAAGGWGSRYDRDAGVAARKQRFLSAVQSKFSEPADILDFGCGSGDIALHLTQSGHRLTGYDLSEAMIAEGRRSDRDRCVQWIAHAEASAEVTLPFETATFDAVVASSVLEYVPDIDATLAQLARILRPGGWLFATVPDMRDPIRHREAWLRRAAAAPGLSTLLDHSRWREGAAYLRISINRMAPDIWRGRLGAANLVAEALPESTGPLLLLTARKT